MNRIYICLLIFSAIAVTRCSRDIRIKIGDNAKYLKENMENRLVISMKSDKDSALDVELMIHNLTDDVTDMPIFKKELTVFPGQNYFTIHLNEIGAGKYGLRLFRQKNLLDYRVLEINP